MILGARAQRKRAMMATLMLSQGTPMILAGDELGNSQTGNNNAYNQDNETSWIDWGGADREFTAFVTRLIAFRKAHPILRQKLFLHSRERREDGVEDLFWWREDGTPMRTSDWQDPARRLLAVEKRTAAGTPAYATLEYAVLLIFNAGEDVDFVLPPAPDGHHWSLEIDSAVPDRPTGLVAGGELAVAGQSVCALVLIAEEERE